MAFTDEAFQGAQAFILSIEGKRWSGISPPRVVRRSFHASTPKGDVRVAVLKTQGLGTAILTPIYASKH